MKLNIYLLNLLLLSLFICSCGGGDEEDPTGVIKDNLKFANQKDLDAYMSTIHEDNPRFEQTRGLMGEVFFKYDIRYELIETEIISDEDDEIKIRFIQITTKRDGNNVRKNQVNGVYILRKSSGFWKIYETDVTDSKFIRE